MTEVELQALFRKLITFSRESEWLEFKHNNTREDEIGEYLSALANGAALHGKEQGYIAWGIEDGTSKVVGTSFRPHHTKVGNETLEAWLSCHLTPRIDFRINEFVFDGYSVVLIVVPAALHTPIRFKEFEWIRIGSYKKKLRDFPEKERSLWLRCSLIAFESEVVADRLSSGEVLRLLDHLSFSELLKAAPSAGASSSIERLEQEKLVVRQSDDRIGITNLGALLFAKRLSDFPTLFRKALRVIEYEGVDRVRRLREHTGSKGYANGFEELIHYLNARLPRNEVLGQALRTEAPMYPPIAIRELVANALIHQELRVSGEGPLVEVFSDRIEITNPGEPLIDPLRFLDSPPRSRNEIVAALMRRLGICEEGGSGIDKVAFEVEFHQLPAPDFQVPPGHTRVILFAHKPFSAMDGQDKTRACYLHACLECVSHRQMTNATLRKRLGIDTTSYPVVSRIIAEAIRAGLVKPYDLDNRSRKHAKYLPFWA
jgi:predicted HTH transcriptional regulator